MRRNGPSSAATRNKKVAAAASTLISYLGVEEAHGEKALLVAMLEDIRARALTGGRVRAHAALTGVEVDLPRSAGLRSEASMAREARRYEGSEPAAYAARAERRGTRRQARQALGGLYRNPLRVLDASSVVVSHSDDYGVPLGVPATLTFGEWSKGFRRAATGLIMVGGRQFRDATSALKSARMSLASNGNAALRWTTADGHQVGTLLRLPARNPSAGANVHPSNHVRGLYAALREDLNRGAITHGEFNVFYQSLSDVDSKEDAMRWGKQYLRFMASR